MSPWALMAVGTGPTEPGGSRTVYLDGKQGACAAAGQANGPHSVVSKSAMSVNRLRNMSFSLFGGSVRHCLLNKRQAGGMALLSKRKGQLNQWSPSLPSLNSSARG